MALKYLADTSVLSRLRKEPVRKTVGELVRSHALARCALTDLELGHSARNASEWDMLQRAVAVCPLIEIEHTDFVRARGVQRALSAQGLRGRKIPDLLIAAVAERSSLAVLHYDQDFEFIAEMTGQQTEWVVERGSVD
ncbi:PIN domain-containing protein [Saccharopolyspora sp. ASAGF58]|uniref:PIN domain-containing protein n=1 Tax=Saccharopolyspora sp. ASAGF58 TaxID=2719023 RepID=UPI00143FE796|nr:PIN domain-containing protein [Saccharopolyspora sp. ASAGF58]QIZ34029.1 PIN domain nuclease [Saccharopolyspora sp. ASAGF58]